MVDTEGKVLEKNLGSRVTDVIVPLGDLLPRQQGHRSGHSTIGTIQEVEEAVRRV